MRRITRHDRRRIIQRIMTNTASAIDLGALNIRRATVPDASALSAFASAAFISTFGPDNDPADMNIYLSGAFSDERQAAEIAAPDCVCLLVESASQIVGYAMLRIGASSIHVPDASSLEIQRLYVDASCHGQGVASRLMNECFEVARAHQATAVWLGVWERNARAIRFYSKHGFTDVGSQQFQLGSDLQTDRVMSRPM